MDRAEKNIAIMIEESYPEGVVWTRPDIKYAIAQYPGVNAEDFDDPDDFVGPDWDGPAFHKEYDLLITGIKLPSSMAGKKAVAKDPELDDRFTGLAIMKKIREIKGPNRDIPFLILSTNGDYEGAPNSKIILPRLRSLNRGGKDRYIFMPSDLEKIIVPAILEMIGYKIKG